VYTEIGAVSGTGLKEDAPGRRTKRMDSGQHKLLLVGIILVQIVGFAVLWMKIPQPGPPVKVIAGKSTFSVVDPDSVAFATKIPDEEVLRQAIDSVLKQELAPYLAQTAAARTGRVQEASRATGGAARSSVASAQASAQSNEVVDRALASGVWTNDDSSALLQVAPQLSEAQRVALLEKIFGAINRQQLKPIGSLPSL